MCWVALGARGGRGGQALFALGMAVAAASVAALAQPAPLDDYASLMGIPRNYQCKCSAFYDFRAPRVRCRCVDKGALPITRCSCSHWPEDSVRSVVCQCEGGAPKAAAFASARNDSTAAPQSGAEAGADAEGDMQLTGQLDEEGGPQEEEETAVTEEEEETAVEDTELFLAAWRDAESAAAEAKAFSEETGLESAVFHDALEEPVLGALDFSAD